MRQCWYRYLASILASLSVGACSASGPARSGTGGSVEEPNAPADPSALSAWLEQGEYRGFAHETATHASAGPHGFVRVFLSKSLVESLRAGASEHPVGGAAVKELYDRADGQVTGWAVAIKTTDSMMKDDWFWYELKHGVA